MRKTLFAFALLLAVLAPADAADDQAYLAILAETHVTKMVGMPEMPALPPGMDLSSLPPEAAAMLGGGGPQRRLNVRLWSPGLAPADASAYITPPAGLKQGKRMDLELYRPEPGKGEAGADTGIDDPKSQDTQKMTIKIYWGSSETVKPGQPKVITWGALTPEQKSEMRQQASKARETSSYFYKPDWTTGYWPTKKQPGQIDKAASLVGSYQLTTTYTGNVAIEAPQDVDFLAPIDFISPSLKKAIPLDKAIKFEWKQIPNVLGLHASIFGMEGTNTMVMWSSSEVFSDSTMFSKMDYLQMAEVRDYVEKTIFMKGDRTSVAVPAGIFEKCQMPMMLMIGYGPGAALDKGQPLPRIQTKTTLSMMLGGMAGTDNVMGVEEPLETDEDESSSDEE